jgi:hypothetical protein
VPTTFFLRNEAPPLLGGAPANKLLDEQRGKSVFSKVTDTTAGATFKQVTDNSGGVVISWYTEMLDAVTVSGPVSLNLRAFESALTVNATLDINVQWVTVIGNLQGTILSARQFPTTTTELTTTDAAYTDTFTPTSVNIRRGDRIRLIVGFRNVGTMAAGTATLSYGATTSGGAGDSFITFTEKIKTFDNVGNASWAGAAQGGIAGWW